MTKGVLSELIGNAGKQIRSKVRKSLQTLQVSADEQELSRNNMIHPDDETASSKKQSKTVEKITKAEKENELALRRSKRKNAISSKLNYAESPDDPKASKSVSAKSKPKKTANKPKKGRPTTLKKSKPENNLCQTKLHFSTVTSGLNNKSQDVLESVPGNTEKSALVTSPSSEIIEDSGIDPSYGVSTQSHTNAVSEVYDVANSTVVPDDNDTCMLTSANPPLMYWKDLAEQRRIALEQTLHENELIHDQLTVLEAENSQLKQLVKEAEQLAEVVRSIVE